MVLLNKNNIITPISKSRFDFDSENIIIDYYCFKITDKYLHFYASFEENEIVPIDEIEKIIKENLKFNIEISILDSIGNILNYIFLEEVRLVKIKKLIDFDYKSKDILSIKVRYVYLNRKIFKNLNDIKKYKRKRKLSKINEKI